MAIQLSNQTKVSTVAASCLLAVVVVLKDIFRVPAEVLAREVIFYIIAYSTFSILYSARNAEAKASRRDNPRYWIAVIVLTTLAIIALHIL